MFYKIFFQQQSHRIYFCYIIVNGYFTWHCTVRTPPMKLPDNAPMKNAIQRFGIWIISVQHCISFLNTYFTDLQTALVCIWTTIHTKHQHYWDKPASTGWQSSSSAASSANKFLASWSKNKSSSLYLNTAGRFSSPDHVMCNASECVSSS
jgi:hypothetical protein